MEFLREGEQEENQILKRGGIKQAELINGNHEGNIKFEMEDEAKPKEAWTIAAMKHSKTIVVPMLEVIGRFLDAF